MGTQMKNCVNPNELRPLCAKHESANTMLHASMISFETLLVAFCVLALLCGLVRITTRRQTEILKEYLQPEKTQIEQIVMRSGHPDENEPGNEPYR